MDVIPSNTSLRIEGKAIEVDSVPNKKCLLSLLVGQLIIIFFVGNTANAADALQQFILLSGAFDRETIERRITMVHFLTGVGISLTFFLSYPINLSVYRLLGPRNTCILGIIFNFLGFCVIMGTNKFYVMIVGITLLSVSACCILCSSLSIACQFPQNTNLILCLLGVVFEASPIFTNLLQFSMGSIGLSKARAMTPIIIAVESITTIYIAATYLPSQPFKSPVIASKTIYSGSIKGAQSKGILQSVQQSLKRQKLYHSYKQPVTKDLGDFKRKNLCKTKSRKKRDKYFYRKYPVNVSDTISSTLEEESKHHHGQLKIRKQHFKGLFKTHRRHYVKLQNLYINPSSIQYAPRTLVPCEWGHSVLVRLSIIDFWIFAPLFTFSVIARKHIIMFVRYAAQEHAPFGTYSFHIVSFGLANLVPISGILIVFWGFLVKRLGKMVTLLLSHALGLLAFLCLLFPSNYVCCLAVAPLFFYIPSAPGLAGLFCHDLYGFTNGHHMVGILTTLAGAISLGHDIIWPVLIIHVWKSYTYAVGVLTAVGSVITFSPLILLFLCQIRQLEEEKAKIVENAKAQFSRIVRRRLNSHGGYLPKQIVIDNTDNIDRKSQVPPASLSSLLSRRKTNSFEKVEADDRENWQPLNTLQSPQLIPLLNDRESVYAECTPYSIKWINKTLNLITPNESITERMLKTVLQIKSFEPLFPLLPIYEKSSSNILAEDSVCQRLLEAWVEELSVVGLSGEQMVLRKALQMRSNN